MSLLHKIHVPEPVAPKTVIFGLLKPPTQLLKLSSGQITWLSTRSARSTVQYENPDLMQPSVSSF
jgi:hypothetical protein